MKEENIGVKSIGIKCPIIREGDDLVEVVYNSIIESGINLQEKDVIGITESVVARSQGNYVHINDIVQFLKENNYSRNLVLMNPIMSRNRFAMILKGFARYANNIVISIDRNKELDEKGNPIYVPNPFTGVDILEYYKEICKSENCNMTVNEHGKMLREGFDRIDCRCHPLHSEDTVMSGYCHDLSTILNTPVLNEHGVSGYNKDWGLLGSNKANEEMLKLFPRRQEAQEMIERLRNKIQDNLGILVEVMVYGDGCFHSPAISGVLGSSIWEFADPVTTPAYTEGLDGTPNEIKIKAFADGKFKDLKGEELSDAIRQEIKNNQKNLKGEMTSQGTTPRRYTDLLASLMDLTSGSGDKGTPVVIVQNYFKKY